MRPTHIVIENFGPFRGRHEFVLAGRGLVLVLGQLTDDPGANSNGAGKSSIFNALDWCLFGKVPTKDHADSIVNDDAKGCRVEVHLKDDDGTRGMVARERPNKLEFVVDGDDHEALDSDETQRAVERWLGQDRDTFHASVLYAQNDLVHFADLTKDSDKMAVLTKMIAELAEVDRLLGPAKVRRDSWKSTVDRLQAELSQLAGEVHALQQIDYTEQGRQWEANRQRDLEAARQRCEAARQAAEQAAPVAVGLTTAMAALAAAEQLPQAPPPPVTSPELQETEQAVATANAEVRRHQASAAGFRQERDRIAATGEGRCPACGSMVTAALLQAELDRLENEADKSDDLARRFGNDAASWSQDLERRRIELSQAVAAAQEDARARAQRVEAAKAAVREAQQAAEVERRQRESADREVREMSRIAELVNPAQTLEAERQVKLDALTAQIEQREKDARGASHELELAEFWVRAFAHDGLKSHVLDHKLGELNEAVNHWVKLLTGGVYWVRLESQRKGRTTKKLTNAPNLRVFKWRPDGRTIERGYRSLSGGQREKVSRAVDLGLAQLVGRRATKKWDLLIFDEIFNHVDSRGADLVAEALRQLRREKSSIFVVHHNADFQGHFEDRTVVRQEKGSSRILEGWDGQEERQAQVQQGRVAQGADPAGDAEPGQKPKRAPAKRRVLRRAAVRRGGARGAP